MAATSFLKIASPCWRPLFVAAVGWFTAVRMDAASATEPGLAVAFTSTSATSPAATDVAVRPNVWLYVPAGEPATPFLPAGNFSATWTGLITLDLRAECAFQAELAGDLKLEINGVVVLEAAGTNSLTAPGKSVRLNKGINTLAATFRSPGSGPAAVRLNWIPRGSLPAPIPLALLSHVPASAETAAARRQLGRELLLEHRCLKCHPGPAGAALPELAMDAPTFEGIGGRRNFDWLARWILDPRALRPLAHMPRVLHGPSAKADAEAAAAFLASLKTGTTTQAVVAPTADQQDAGKKLFATLHCAACHNAPDTDEADVQKISLQRVTEKFATGTLPGFLQKPDAHFVWTRMPRFQLSDDEAAQLAAFLLAGTAAPQTAPAAPVLVARGRKVVQTSGCLNCHALKLENQFTARPLAGLPAERWAQGCLAAGPDEDSQAPRFTFTDGERAAFAAFGAGDRASLLRHVPAEFAQRQSRLLRCTECHGKFEGFPAFDLLGEKLRPEWARAFIAGEIAAKPRFWLADRMPAFPPRAQGLAQGLAMLHGYAPLTAPEPPVDAEAAKVGAKLVSAEGGFSCVQCHGVAKVGATQILESNGINLALAGARLRKPYFLRWLRNPQLLDPTTRMPVYFDEEGKSPLADVLGGDADQQLEALWQYLQLGDQMPPPPGTRPAP